MQISFKQWTGYPFACPKEKHTIYEIQHPQKCIFIPENQKPSSKNHKALLGKHIRQKSKPHNYTTRKKPTPDEISCNMAS